MPAPRSPPPPRLSRRSLLVRSLITAGLLTAGPVTSMASPALTVGNVTGLYDVEVDRIARPRTTGEVIAVVSAYPGRIAVGGARFSMGGQIAVRHGLHLDMRKMNQLVWLRPDQGVARVQAGMTWRDLMDHIDPHGLAVRVMQSYSNFSIGGSVSVNAHGRYVGLGPVGNTVRALQLVLADDSIVEADAQRNTSLLRAAIGGYGAIGVISEVELDLAANRPVARTVTQVPLDNYVAHFLTSVLPDPHAVLHNADLLPPDFSHPICSTWREAPVQALTVKERLVPRGLAYHREQNAIWAISELPAGDRIRQSLVQPELEKPVVKWLNHEASQDTAQLEPRTRWLSTYALQEYFVPGNQLPGFVRSMARIVRDHGVQVLNVSIRHSPADTRSLLPWAPHETFSLVVYYKQRTFAKAREQVAAWTRAMIDLALAHGGRYYLPYQLHATQAQFEAAYPEVVHLRRLKSQVDPLGRFSNELWRNYL